MLGYKNYVINIKLALSNYRIIAYKSIVIMLLKKSLIHAGALISLIILVVLLLANWDKCMANPLQKWLEPAPARIPPAQSTKQAATNSTKEGFETIQDAQSKGIDARDITVDLNPTARQVQVSFTGISASQMPTDHNVKSYLLVMAKYDKDLNKVGTLDVKLSEEEGGRTLAEDLAAFTDKYSGSLTTGRQTSINTITTSSPAQQVLNAFMGSTTDKTLVDLGTQPTQEIGMFFELLGLVYNYKLSGSAKLNDLYSDLRSIYSVLPSETTPTTGDANYDYLSIDNTDNTKAAANLKRAMANLSALKSAFETGSGKPTQSVLNALKAFMEELMRMVESGAESATGNICDSVTGKCKYTFTQVEPVDAQGNIYYYKLGVGVIFVNTTTGADAVSVIKPYTFGSGNKLQYFRVDTSLADQERLLKRLEELERVTAQKALQQPVTAADGSKVDANGNPVVGGMDAYINMLKPYLGNYPEEYLLTSGQGKELTLDRYINKSLATGELNVNIDLSGLTPSTTALAGAV